MERKFLTIEDLYQFCKSNNFSHFNSKEFNGPIVLQSFEEVESIGDSNNGLCPVQLKACHIGLNANKSTISEQSMKNALDSFRGRPILGSIIKLDSGEYDFHSHDINIVVNEDGTAEQEYIEIPVGVTDQTQSPTLRYDKAEDKTYVMISGNIFEDYSKAADIMRRRRTAKCSVEIAVEELSYDAEHDALSIDKFHFTGVTILGHEPDGTEIQEGMKGSKITIDSFSADNNGMFGINYQDKMIEVLEKLNTTLSNFSDKHIKKGGGVTMENENAIDVIVSESMENSHDTDNNEIVVETEADVTVEIETVDVEADESSIETGDEVVVDDVAVDEPATAEEPAESEAPVAEEFSETKPEVLVCTFRISHDDTRYGLQSLLNAMCDDTHFYCVESVYDRYFYYCDYFSGDAFKQAYKIRKDVVSFDGDPEPVYREFVTQAERNELEKLRKDYAELKEFKDQYDAAELRAQKDAILSKKSYEKLVNVKEFVELKANSDNLTVDELQSRAKMIYADYMENHEDNEPVVVQPKAIGFNFNIKETKKKPYGNLFK